LIRKCLKIIYQNYVHVHINVPGLSSALCSHPQLLPFSRLSCWGYISTQNGLTVKNRLSEKLVWSKFRSDLSFLIIIWRLTFKNDAFSLNSTEFTRWAYPSNCIWFTCDHDRYVWLNQIENSLYQACSLYQISEFLLPSDNFLNGPVLELLHGCSHKW